MSDDRPCTCPPMERPHPCARKFALSECKARPFCYLVQTSSDRNPPHGWAVHFTDGEIPLYTADALTAARDAALEEAARMCEHNASLYPYLGTGWESSIECAAAIRVLKEKRDE